MNNNVRRLLDQRNATVGIAAVNLLGPNERRIAVVVSAPPAKVQYGVVGTVSALAVDTSTTGTKLAYTVPAGRQAIVDFAAFFIRGGTAPTATLRLTRSSVTTKLASSAASFVQQLGIVLAAGDVIDWNVSPAGAASTADFSIGVREDVAASRLTLAFSQDAVDGLGVSIHPGSAPLVLSGEHIGQAFRGRISAVVDQGSVSIGVLDIFEDCECLEYQGIHTKGY